jgi:4-diphosphocytidyl-2-C-methyl-D-erythritol kinase
VKVLAPAKINIYLRVIRKRPDRYHELRTIMVPVSFADEITLEGAPSAITLIAQGCGCSTKDNLAYRAARLFLEKTGIPGGVSIEIEKRIPVGTGLGGGSSDAAIVLLAMNELFGAGLSEDQLVLLARELGADCPFFIYRKAMLMGSRGDIPIQEAKLESRTYLLVIPPFGISTAEVFSRFTFPLTPEEDRITIDTIDSNGIMPEHWVFNDLEAVVFGIHPELTGIKVELIKAGALKAGMSGSGSAVFGIFESDAHLCDAMSRLERHEGYSYIPTTRLTGDRYGDYRGQGVSGQG